MSTRIHKAMGYGMVHPDRPWLDQRLYTDDKPGEVDAFVRGHYRRQADSKERGWSQLGFDCLHQHMSEKDRERYPKTFSETVRYAEYTDTDGGLSLIIPPSQATYWFRFDDILDYTEVQAQRLEDPLVTVVKELPVPIYPYLNWMDPVTGEKLEHYSNISDRKRYVEDHGHAPVPLPPEVILLIAEELRFGDWKQLRPYVCTWWS
ncbi:hypothetical protein [Roseococcus pinisoli]|uniref:Uncharacterized protein n=1 Tax=Roseococcus pinisoli TaxID=2835040 RepID=A0ABS5QFG0_9PROT|nr:hypothetical protein [Roseococcus pinisoli]MBS7812282.1 hypothetical protein [Roseococcus pinisoli]